jgi:hypothetical protein
MSFPGTPYPPISFRFAIFTPFTRTSYSARILNMSMMNPGISRRALSKSIPATSAYP